MIKMIGVIFFGAIVSVLTAGCATIQDPGRADFLSDYSKLEEIAENRLVYDSGNLGSYSKFIIDPVVMLYSDPEDKRIFTDKELENLRTHFETKVREALIKGDGYQIVEEAGEGTAKLRIAITGVDDTIGALNITIYTKITGAGLGGASMEGEVLDSMTGEQLGAVIQWGSGSRILRAGFTHTGDAKLVINRWAKAMRDTIDAAHGR